uniref:Uncharacterized protein n=1 Tax=Chrysemys picta bellii TaxID=8478 RepID=A0A8C3FM07_CHRPI
CPAGARSPRALHAWRHDHQHRNRPHGPLANGWWCGTPGTRGGLPSLCRLPGQWRGPPIGNISLFAFVFLVAGKIQRVKTNFKSFLFIQSIFCDFF